MIDSPTGSRAYVLRVLDVGASIDVARASTVLGARASRGASTLRGPVGAGAGGVLLAQSPLDVAPGGVQVGELHATVRVRLFQFGVVAVRFCIDLAARPPDDLAAFTSFVEDDAGFDEAARRVWTDLAAELGDVVAPGRVLDFVEDYTVVLLPELPGEPAKQDELVARIVLGESSPRALHPEVVDDVRRRAIRYFADDVVHVDYDAALIVDPSLHTELVDIFEVATAHLLELRYYDALLSRAAATMTVDATRSRALRWLRGSFDERAERAVMVVLELTELTDRFQHAITLLGDTYSVRVYRAAAERLRIDEATEVVYQKLERVARSAEVLNEHVQSRRTLVLEISVVVLIMLELGFAIFRH